MFDSLWKGAWLGFCIAAPVGPIGMMVLKESLARGRWAGLASGTGAALADLTYGALAVAGVRLASGYERQFGIAGGLLLLWLAWRSWREAPATDAGGTSELSGRLLTNMLKTYGLTISNPMTILMFAALVVTVGSGSPLGFVAGVFAGSLLWWIFLSSAAAWARTFISLRGAVLNRAAGITLAAFGLWELFTKGLPH